MNATISPIRRITPPKRTEPKSFMDSHEFVELRNTPSSPHSSSSVGESTLDKKGKKSKPALTIALKDMSKKGTKEEKQGLMMDVSPEKRREGERGGGDDDLLISPDSQSGPSESPFKNIASHVVAAFDQAGSSSNHSNV